MLDPKVRHCLEQVDQKYQQGGMPAFHELEASLEDADRAGDKHVQAETLTQLGIRLVSIAKFVNALEQQGQDLGTLPAASDALAPAIEHLDRSLQISVSLNDDASEKYLRDLLADCYLQAKRYEEAFKQLSALFGKCRFPQDSELCLKASQKAGDCFEALEVDEQALIWHEKGLGFAKEIDDPFEISVQLGKIGNTLSNLKRYDTALEYFGQARDLLIRIGNEDRLRQKISVHKNLFNVSAIPAIVADIDARISRAHDGLGRELLRALPDRLAAGAQAAFQGHTAPVTSDWAVLRKLDLALRSAARILVELLNEGRGPVVPAEILDEDSILQMIGSLARCRFGDDIHDPADLNQAARYAVQVDRSRRAAAHVHAAEESSVGPGPFGGGTSRTVLYLRSFVASPRLPRVDVDNWGKVDLEEFLACKLDRSPLIALGDPDLERFGPGRSQTTDENWQGVLRALAMEAQMLLVIPAATDGTSWEIEWLVANKFLHKTCFIMPPPAPGQESWWTENWRELKEWSVRLGLKLPEYTPEGCIFRLTSEGLVDQIEFSEVFDDDLHMTLLQKLLFLPNLSFDFLFGAQQAFEEHAKATNDGEESSIEERLDSIGAAETSAEDIETLITLEEGIRFDLSNWHFDAENVPEAPGVLMLYESPTRLLWAEDVSNIRDAIAGHAQGRASDFTRAFFHIRIVKFLGAEAASQIKDGELSIGTVVSFRAKQLVSYKFFGLPKPDARGRIVDLIWRGALKHGEPILPRVADAY